VKKKLEISNAVGWAGSPAHAVRVALCHSAWANKLPILRVVIPVKTGIQIFVILSQTKDPACNKV